MSAVPTKTLSSVCDILMGQAPKGDSYNAIGSGYPLIAGAGDFGELTPAPKQYTDAPTKLSRPGDLILCIRATIGDRNWSDKEYCLGRGVAGLRAKASTLNQAYLGHWLDHAAPALRARGRGATFLQVSKRDIASLDVPLPPLAEQKRIARILDAADALRAKRREALAQLDTLLQSTFLDMFGDPVTNPMGWKVTTVERIGSTQGGLQVTSKRRSLPIERPYLRVANVFRGYLELDELKTIRLTEAEELRTSLECEDILIVEGHGNKEEIGRCARWDGSIAQCVHQNHLIRLRCDRSKASPLYVENYINSPGGRKSLTGTSRTTSGLNTISVSKVRNSEIQLPPVDLQHRFAAIVDSVEHQRGRQRAHLAELDALFASLQSRAFRGDL